MTPTKCSITGMSSACCCAGGHHRRNPRLQQTDRRAESAQSDCQRRCRLYGAGAADGAGQAGRGYRFGSAQRFGVPMGYGGRTRPSSRRKMNSNAPCRAGLSAYRKMRREYRAAHGDADSRAASAVKANSNICTSQVLLANIASLYAVFHGPAGLKRIAGRIHRRPTFWPTACRRAEAAPCPLLRHPVRRSGG